MKDNGFEHKCYLMIILVSLKIRCPFLLFPHNLECIWMIVWRTLFTLYFPWGFIGSAVCKHFIFFQSLILPFFCGVGVWSRAVWVPSACPADEHSLHSLPAPAERQCSPLLDVPDQRWKPLGMFAHFVCLVMPLVFLASTSPSRREYCHILKGWICDLSVWVFFLEVVSWTLLSSLWIGRSQA